MIMNKGLYTRRKAANAIFLGLSVCAALFGLMWLGLILETLFYNGFSSISPEVFSEITPPPGDAGGLANAIVGSLIMSAIAVAVGTPIGLLAGTFLAEYGRHTTVSVVVRFVNDILLSAPSIVIGLFIYWLLVKNIIGHFSGIAGVAALTVIVIPVVVRTTENMLLLVPNQLREAAAALGAPRNHIVQSVTWKAARAGMLTGVLLAVARISGETAPLLFTALNNSGWGTLNEPMANLPYVIFQFAMSPYEDWHKLAWAGALLITIAVLSLSVIARILESSKRS